MPSNSQDLWIIIIITIVSMFFLFYGLDSNVIGETPCVDGNNRINLEGIMCGDKESTWFGLNEGWAVITTLPSILYILFVIFGGCKK